VAAGATAELAELQLAKNKPKVTANKREKNMRCFCMGLPSS
jgi:hypothetical protein